MSDLVGNPEDRFSRVAAHLIVTFVPTCEVQNYKVSKDKILTLRILNTDKEKYNILTNTHASFIKTKNKGY